jgi:predicted acetyltransferase
MAISPIDSLLVMPSVTHARSYQAAMAEGYQPDPAAPPVSDQASLDAHLTWLNAQGGEIRLPDGRMVPRTPHTQLWLVHDYTFIGRVNIRFRLNDALRIWGGHIGYAIRPSFQGRGFGRHILRLALPVARDTGLHSVLLTCLDTNKPSIRIIEANGGQLAETGPHPTTATQTVRRYWIELAE